MQIPRGFKIVDRDGEHAFEKPVNGGGRMEFDDGQFAAFDAKGRYLGYTQDERTARLMALSGRINCPHLNYASDLSVWQLWNDAVHGAVEPVMCDDMGNQFLALDQNTYLRAAETDGGFEVEFLCYDDVVERYWRDEECFALTWLEGLGLKME